MALPVHFSFVWKNLVAGSAHPGSGRNLIPTLESLLEAGVSSIVSLTEDPLDFAPIREVDFDYLHVPVEDFTAPSLHQIEQIIEFLNQQVSHGRGALVHCHAGVGRTGTLLACFLVSQGIEPAEAIGRIRQLRPGSCEVYSQEFAVFGYAKHLARESESLEED